MDKDVILTYIFETMAAHESTRGVGKFILQGAEYFVCSVAAMQREPLSTDADTLKPGVMYPYDEDEYPVFDVTDFNRFRPEVALEYDFLPLKDSHFEHCNRKYFLLPVKNPPIGKPGFWLLEHQPDDAIFKYIRTIPFGNTRFLKEANMTAYSMPKALGDTLQEYKMSLSDLDGCLMVSKLSHHLSIGLTGDTAFMYASLSSLPVTNPAYKHILVEDTVYTCDGLEEFEVLGKAGKVRSSRYTAIIRKKGNDMKLPSPVQEKKEAIEASMKASELVTTASPSDQEINKAVNAPVIPASEPVKKASGLRAQAAEANIPAVNCEVPAATLGDTCTVEELQEMEATAAEEAVTETADVPQAADPAEVVVQEAPSEQQDPVKNQEKPKAKRRTKQATAAGGFDFEAVITYLGSPAQPIDIGDLESVLAEIRSLRDVQITAARRAANLTSEICKISENGLRTLAELQAVLNKK